MNTEDGVKFLIKKMCVYYVQNDSPYAPVLIEKQSVFTLLSQYENFLVHIIFQKLTQNQYRTHWHWTCVIRSTRRIREIYKESTIHVYLS